MQKQLEPGRGWRWRRLKSAVAGEATLLLIVAVLLVRVFGNCAGDAMGTRGRPEPAVAERKEEVIAEWQAKWEKERLHPCEMVTCEPNEPTRPRQVVYRAGDVRPGS